MNKLNRLIATVALVSISAVPLTVSAGQADQAQQAPAAASATGELVSVDVTAKTLVIKPASGQDMTFSFTEQTKITGANSPAGLATMGGSQATVTYTTKDRVQTATAIQVAAKK